MADLKISDHALVRWLDRTGLMDAAPLKAVLAASLSAAANAAARLGNQDYLILADGLVYVVRDGVLVNVSTDDGRHAQARELAARG